MAALANNAVMQLLSRLALLIGIPALLAVCGWIGTSVVDLKVAVGSIEATVGSLQHQVDLLADGTKAAQK